MKIKIKKGKAFDIFDPSLVRFCGGSKMIVGDKDIFLVCAALIACIKGIEGLPLKKRSIFHNYMLSEWSRLLSSEAEWLQRIEDFNNGD